MWSSILRRLSSLVFCLLFANSVWAGVTDLRLKVDQIFDVQWYISGGTLNASGFNYIYSSINYATQTASAARWTAAQKSDAGSNNRYIAFFNSTTNPGTYGMAVYESNGTLYKIINNTGTFRALAQGAIFYNGNGMWGTLITTEAGYANGSSGSWTVTADNPTNAQLSAYVAPTYSSGTPAPPPAATPVYSSGITQSQQTRKNAELQGITGHVITANLSGDNNDVYITQANGRHVTTLEVQGSGNGITILQQGTSLLVSHYLESAIIGSNNLINIQQKDASKTAFANVLGNHNSLTMKQTGLGNHFLDVSLIGDSHTASLLQSGSGNHAATVQLTNGGGPWNFQLNQSGNTSKTYSLPHSMSDGSTVSGTCNVAGGCNLIINQP